MKREFITEFSIGYLNSFTAMLIAHQLLNGGEMSAEQAEALSECHIYAIAARPAPFFKEGSLKHDGNFLSGSICYRVEGV